MRNGEAFRPYALAGMALLMLKIGLSADVDLTQWLGIGSAMFTAAAAGWFFRDVRTKTGN
jgi:hypothetical protein